MDRPRGLGGRWICPRTGAGEAARAGSVDPLLLMAAERGVEARGRCTKEGKHVHSSLFLRRVPRGETMKMGWRGESTSWDESTRGKSCRGTLEAVQLYGGNGHSSRDAYAVASSSSSSLQPIVSVSPQGSSTNDMCFFPDVQPTAPCVPGPKSSGVRRWTNCLPARLPA